MTYVIQNQTHEEGGILYLLAEFAGEDTKATWKTAEEILSSRPEVIESYYVLNAAWGKEIRTFEGKVHARIMPKTYQDLIENCLDESHYSAALDLMESFQNEHEYLPEHHIRRVMDLIVNEKVEDNVAARAYKLLQHVLQTSGSEPFQNIWKIPKELPEQDGLWAEYPLDFWKFIQTKLVSSSMNGEAKKIIRESMLLDHIISIFEFDLLIKKDKLGSCMILQIFPKNYGRVRNNIKYPIEALLAPFSMAEICPIETARLSQRLLGQIIILSYAGIICHDTLKREMYLLINKFNPENFELFIQTINFNTFKSKLLDHALQDANLGEVSRTYKSLIHAGLDLSKIIHVYFQSTPYYRKVSRSTAICRHTFILVTLLQSYIQSKLLRIDSKVYCGLSKEERNLLAEDLIRPKLEELEQWLDDEKTIDKRLRRRAKFMIELANIALDTQQPMEIINIS
ncbi:hypothetical protein G9A89_012200 [Geosiphon pyriformis]|nr:hypothetical protein G9A89_012200 [Geosiphon pyriformis]